jgi:Asp-tRNA(Asn)/Glu-tRNA(Gln) amidotransferase A subunit family amidase
VFADHVPSETAEAVRRLEAAGWVLAGKANLHEFAYGVTSQNLHYGVVPNPSFPGRTAGGSSGGSAAALALGLVDGALGTDTGGSIRIPAACCGVVGFKPGYGVVPIDGVFPLAPSFDHAGPMARDVATCIELMRALEPSLELPDVALADLRLASAWGASGGRPVEFPTATEVFPAFQREIADVHRELFAENEELYGENIRAKVEACLAVGDAEYAAAVHARAAHAERAAAALEGYDLLLAPVLSCPVPAADVDEIAVRAAMTLYTFPFNALGWPALAVGGTQVVGRRGADGLVLAAALELERVLKP